MTMKESSANSIEDEETANAAALKNNPTDSSTLDESAAAASSMPKLDEERDVVTYLAHQLVPDADNNSTHSTRSSQGGRSEDEPKKGCYYLIVLCTGIVGFFLAMILLMVVVSRRNQEDDIARHGSSSSQPKPSLNTTLGDDDDDDDDTNANYSSRDPTNVLARQVWNDNVVNTAPPFDTSDNCIVHPGMAVVMSPTAPESCYNCVLNETFQDMAWTMISVFLDERLTRNVESNLLIGPYGSFHVGDDSDVAASQQCTIMHIFSEYELEISTRVPVDLAFNLTQARVQWLERVGSKADKKNNTETRDR